ncbi:MAG: ATP-dependent metallopeptidase FtsH/Yme1/Tma family protein [Candidatus Eisenbacteria bacterium]|uniref:ATP-dependent zinc metalloprotease FtsH n=1 Tax=Eiseniibacteriota bacterium TaxID=2212470 RepID=A0A849SME4_UNCEI|nr:ATP-dependent metallopeptidase FtsH/Yme1/Tma family protein [Candidatus Eisenbacteria bacterium]
MYQGNFMATPRAEINYTRFLKETDAGNLANVEIVDKTVTGDLKIETTLRVGQHDLRFKAFKTAIPGTGETLVDRVLASNPDIPVVFRPAGFNWISFLIAALPFLLLLPIWMLLLRQMQGSGSAALKFGKTRSKVLIESAPKVTFKDVAGCDEAKQELEEIIEFLKEPQKFQRLGGRIPKGALLLGPPGSGKTLLAKAVAGEAAVPFFSMSGSDFVEMFVGVGASRVRDLFEQGKRNAPCIIFIDEIDAVGRHRGAGLGGGHDEREQTLNQLLVEMDGFESNEGVIIVAATNRPDVLDPALLRPGRFDRQIVVDWPDVRGREGIFKVHTRTIPLDEDVDLYQLARSTPGMAGADIANVVNEAALLAARRNKKKVSQQDFEDAKDKVTLGMERKSLVMNENERRSTAYHEAGHALVAWLQPGTDPVDKVTIIPRGRALGITSWVPPEDRYSQSKAEIEQRLANMMGGRAAEFLVFSHYTTGASNDLERATALARRMVCELGMSDNLGPLTFGKKEEMVFLGREISSQKDYSEKTAQAIDQEVRTIVERAYNKAIGLLRENLPKLDLLANSLLERETIDGEEMDRLLKGEKLEPLKRDTDIPPAPPVAVTESATPVTGGLEGFPPPEPRPAGA